MSENTFRCPYCFATYSQPGPCPHCAYSEGNTPTDSICLPPGTVLENRYALGRVLGNGGFGITYLAWDRVNDCKVAIKEYLPTELATRGRGETRVTVFSGKKEEFFEKGRAQFSKEAQILATFRDHPAIVDILDDFEANGTHYNVMEYIPGKTIAAILRDCGKLSAEETLFYILPIVEGLKAVHAAGLIHRDIAPDNIMVTQDGYAKLIDFGSARYAAFNSSNKSLTVMVKQGYSAPEQYMTKGSRGTFTDVYAIGATMYKMLTGVTPPESLERKTQIMESDSDPLEPIGLYAPESAYLEPLILEAMNVFPKQRIPDMDALYLRMREFGMPSEGSAGFVPNGEYEAAEPQMRIEDQQTVLVDGSPAGYIQPEWGYAGPVMEPGGDIRQDDGHTVYVELENGNGNNWIPPETMEQPERSGSAGKTVLTVLVSALAVALVIFLVIVVFGQKKTDSSDDPESTTFPEYYTAAAYTLADEPTERVTEPYSEWTPPTVPPTTETTTSTTVKLYTVNITGDKHVRRISGVTQHRPGDHVTITATPDDGYAIAGWSGDYTSSSTQVSFNMPENDVRLYVYTAEIQTSPRATEPTTEPEYTLTITADTGVRAVEGTDLYSNYSTITMHYKANTYVEFEATAFTGYRIMGWSGTYSSSTRSISFTMPARDVALHVKTAKTYTVSVNNERGVSRITGLKDSYVAGESVRLTIETYDSARTYYVWEFCDSGDTVWYQTISFAMPSKDVELNAYVLTEEEYQSLP